MLEVRHFFDHYQLGIPLTDPRESQKYDIGQFAFSVRVYDRDSWALAYVRFSWMTQNQL